MQIIEDKTKWYLKSPTPDAYGQGAHGTTLNRNNAYPYLVQSAVTDSDTLPYTWHASGTRSPSMSSFPASAVESLESIKRFLKMAGADRDTLWQMPLFSLLAQSRPRSLSSILRDLLFGFVAGCVHDDPIPKAHTTSGRPRLAH